jgi:hypothetical protein
VVSESLTPESQMTAAEPTKISNNNYDGWPATAAPPDPAPVDGHP